MPWSSVAEVENGVLESTALKVPHQAQKSVFEQFQAGHGYTRSGGTGVLSDDTSDFVIGTQSLKLVTLGDEAYNQVGRKSIGPYDFANRDLRITFKVQGLAHVRTFEVFLSSDNQTTNNLHYSISIPVQPYIADGEWASVTISWGDLTNNFASGAINRAKVNNVEFRLEDDNTAPVTFHINEVAAVPRATNGMVSIVFDDGWDSTYTRARPYLDKYGFRGDAAIIRDVIGTPGYMSIAQLRALQDLSGWDIVAHADTVANHNAGYGNLENAVVEAEMKGIKRWLLDNGFKRRDLFVWPLGSYTASQMVMARRLFSVVRGTTGGGGGASGPQETFPPGDNGRLRTWTIGHTTSAEEVANALAQAVTHRSWLILSFHKIVASGAKVGTETNEAAFKEIIDEVAASGLAVKTMAEVMES
jgi:peptidoglycan/xylan/chitin deacetylase (PgdA/CDA1 family)